MKMIKKRRKPTRAKSKRATKYAGIPLRDPALVALFGQRDSSSGIDVTEDTALNFSAVWAAVQLISSSVAAMPVGIYRKRGKYGREEMPQHPMSWILGHQPNPEMTPYVFQETLMHHVLLWGNYYARKMREKKRGPVIGLMPLMPNQTEPDRDEQGTLYYKFYARHAGEKDEDIPAEEVIHVPGLSFDGLKGYSVVERARETIGLGLAAEKFGASFYGRGSLPGGAIKHPGDLDEQARRNLRESWEALHRGPDNAHRVAILDEGMEWIQIGMPLADAQFLETRAFSIVEIARWFNVPPHMLRDLVNATFSNIEHQGIDFLTYTLLPWLVRIRQEYNRKLFSYQERQSLFVAHDTTALLQTDTVTRFNAYSIGRRNGWLSINDIKRKENMDTLDGPEGEQLIQEANLVPLGHFDTKPEETDGAKVEDVAMNGAQVTSLLTILQAVAAGTVAAESAHHMISIAFPTVNDATVTKMLAPYAHVELKDITDEEQQNSGVDTK